MVKEKPSAPTRAPQGFRQMSNNDSTSDPDEPKVSCNAIVCEFPTFPCDTPFKWLESFFGKSKMILDPEAGVIYFKKCFVPYGYLPRRIRGWYACELSDIQSILFKAISGSKYMAIDTVHGKVMLISCSTEEACRIELYLKEYIRCQEKESPLSRLKKKAIGLVFIDELEGGFGFVKGLFLTLMCVYGLFFSIKLLTNNSDDSGLSLTVFGLLGGITGWLGGALICYFLLILLPEKITKSRTRFGCILLLLAVWPVWIYLLYLMLEMIKWVIDIIPQDDQVFWFSRIAVVGLIVALGCSVLIRSIFRYRRAVTESLQGSELSGPENQQPDKKPEELLADISSSAGENPSAQWSENE